MRHATLFIILFALLTTLGSCNRHAAATNDTKAVHYRTDTVIIHEDGLVYVPFAVPGDSLRVLIPVDCDSLGRVRSAELSATGRSAYLHSSLFMIGDSSYIRVDAGCAAYIDSVEHMQVTIEHLVHERDSVASAIRETVMVQYIPGFYKWCTGLFWALLVLLIAGGALYLYFKIKP